MAETLKLSMAVALGATLFAATQFVYQQSATCIEDHLKRLLTHKEQKAKDAGHSSTGAGGSAQAQDELMREQLSRIRSFFGDAGFEEIQKSFVVVVGLGGVGSHAAHMLARSGVGKLRLVDFDNVTLSSLNRHAVATRADVGIPKAVAMKKHLLETVPHCDIEACPVMFEEASAEELLDGNPTYVLDCIDDVNTKLALLEAVSTRQLRVITATGAGAKADPTRLHIGTLKDCVRDPLATKMRYFLKKKGISTESITTVYSSEKSVCKLLPLDEQQAAEPGAFGNVENFRIRVLPVLGTMPALFGQAMAAYVMTDLAHQPIHPEPIARLAKDQRNKLYQKLQDREKHTFGNDKFYLDKDLLEFIYQEIWRGRSAVSDVRQGGRERMMMSRWHQDQPFALNNAVFLTAKEIEKMDQLGLQQAFGPETCSRIDAHLRQYEAW